MSQEQAAEKIKKPIEFRTVLPNIITLSALCLGVTSIKLAFMGQVSLAIIAILVSAFLDGMDGQVARALRGTSSFGAELDSLADLVNFGVSPALVVYFWGIHELGNLGWCACLVFIMCMALRLARFNVLNNLSIDDTPTSPKTYFLGIPAPASALLLLFPLCLDVLGVIKGNHTIYYVIALYMLILSALTVSTIKTFSPKSIRFQRKIAKFFIILVAIFFVFLISFPYHVLALSSCVYMVHIFYAVLRLLRKTNKIEVK